MGIGDIVLIGVGLPALLILLNPRMTNWRSWRAIVTPLASIIGSGFLVAGPILSHAAGNYAWAAMLGLCGVGYYFGSAIRHNIRYVEPVLDNGAPRAALSIEDASQVSLSLAYFVSVAYYLNLFSAFALRSGGIVDPVWIKVLATLVIGSIGLMGILRGLSALEKLETLAVGLKLSMIGALCVSLLIISGMAFSAGTFSWPSFSHQTGLEEVKILLGLVILVQGFETSRYLGAEYSGRMRIRTMKQAQWISTGVYLVFILLVTRYFTGELPPEGGETQIIDLLQPVGVLVAPLIIVIALASQLSAAVADLNGSGGLIRETSRKKLTVQWGYGVTALASIIVTWSADIYQIITYASKAFVLYYGLQCLQAALSAARIGGHEMKWRVLMYSAGVVLALAIILFAIPAEA